MENILISAICSADLNLYNELTKLAGMNECLISYSRLYTLGLDQAITLKISGNWSGIAKIEAALPSIAKRLDVDIIFKRHHDEKIDRYHLPYNVALIAVDQPGLVYEIFEFINGLDIITNHLEVSSVKHQQTPLLRIKMSIEIPADTNIADIREQFLVFCDELNLDGILEPTR